MNGCIDCFSRCVDGDLQNQQPALSKVLHLLLGAAREGIQGALFRPQEWGGGLSILTYAHYFSFYLRSSHDLLFLLKNGQSVVALMKSSSCVIIINITISGGHLSSLCEFSSWMRRCFLHNLSKVVLLMNYTVFTHQKRKNVFVIKTKSEVQFNRFIHTRHFGGQKQKGKCAIYCLEWKPLILTSLSEFWLLKAHD